MSYAKNPPSYSKPQKELFSKILTLGYEARMNELQKPQNKQKENKSEKEIEKNVRHASETKIASQKTEIKSQQEISKEKEMEKIKNTQEETVKQKISLSVKISDPAAYLIAYQNKMKSQKEMPPDFLNSPTYNLSPTNLAKRMKEPEDEYAFLKEKNEWVVINKYKLYKESKEKQDKKDNYLKEMEKLTGYIDTQLKQKKERIKLKTQEEYQYLDYLKERNRKEIEKELEMKEIKKQRKKIEKVLRDTEIKQKVLKKRALRKQQREYEEKLVACGPMINDQNIEKRKQKQKKEKEISEQYFQESLKKKNKKFEARQFEMAENQQYQKDFANDLDQKEAIRQALIKEKQNEVLHKLEEAVSYDKEVLEPKKYQKIIEGFTKSVQRQDKMFSEKQQDDKLKKSSEYQDLKLLLEEQIQVKKMKDEMEKKRYNNQQEIWRKENEIYNDLERKKKEEKMHMKEQWALELKNQMKEREELKIKYKNKMSEEESLMNKPLLDELQNFKLSISVGNH